MNITVHGSIGFFVVFIAVTRPVGIEAVLNFKRVTGQKGMILSRVIPSGKVNRCFGINLVDSVVQSDQVLILLVVAKPQNLGTKVEQQGAYSKTER